MISIQPNCVAMDTGLVGEVWVSLCVSADTNHHVMAGCLAPHAAPKWSTDHFLQPRWLGKPQGPGGLFGYGV